MSWMSSVGTRSWDDGLDGSFPYYLANSQTRCYIRMGRKRSLDVSPTRILEW
jgi:hypothetical protein